MICYYYPPLTDVGCKRSVCFAKYFKEYGWTPFVLSVKNPDKTYCALGNDSPPPGIHTEYSSSIINVYKFFGKVNGLTSRLLKAIGIDLKGNYFLDIFCIPDIFVGWIPLSLRSGLQLIRKNDIDVIYVSCSPFSSAITGVLLKHLTGKPLILDFRDPYALEIDWLERIIGVPRFRKNVDKRIANFILDQADIFIANTEETREFYLQQYPQVKDKIFTVHNGFDSVFMPPPNPRSKFPKFTIIYTGEFYFYALKSQVFFEALSTLKRVQKIKGENFQFLFYGDGKGRIEKIAEKYHIGDIVKAYSRIPYSDVLKAIQRSHLQLLRIVKPMISTKLFEGIPLNIPFLATIPAGEVESIIKKYSPSSYIINDESADMVAEAIIDAMAKYNRNEIRDNRIAEFLEGFSRENLTLKLMRIIKERLG